MKMSLGIALESATPNDIPNIFFNLDISDRLNHSISSEKRQTNEKIGDFDCYVISDDSVLGPRTFWIGKQDFFIHQIRTVVIETVDTAKASNNAQTETAQLAPDLPKKPEVKPGDISSIETETHMNIVVNQKFVPTDFVR